MDKSSLQAPAQLAELVQYQDDAVVSLAIAKSKAGTVTIFAFDAGEGLSEHTAPFDALLMIVDGHAAITVGGTKHAMAAGQIIRLPANVPHAVHAERRFKMMLVMIRAEAG